MYLAYTVSFVNLAVVWLGHRTLFTRLSAIDIPLTLANLGILFSAALIPFGTSVVSQALKAGSESNTRAAIGLYALIGALLMASYLVFNSWILRNAGLAEQGRSGFFRKDRRKALLGFVLFLAGGLSGYLSPWIALTIFLGVPVFFGATAPRD